MKVIADSGSTKTAWAFIQGKTVREFRTEGLNPNYISPDFFKTVIDGAEFKHLCPQVTSVQFYGAGISDTSTSHAEMQNNLEAAFPNAKITLSNDITAAAQAVTMPGEPSIVSILGTGSNCCLWDGYNTHPGLPSLGFVIGDEGSGANIGKSLLRAFAYNQLSSKIRRALIDQYGLTKDQIINGLLKQPKPNTFAASFAQFVLENQEDQWLQNILEEAFHSFITTHIMHFPNFKNLPCHFVGSIAYYGQNTLKKVAAKKGLKIGTILSSPIEGLIAKSISEN